MQRNLGQFALYRHERLVIGNADLADFVTRQIGLAGQGTEKGAIRAKLKAAAPAMRIP